MLRHRRPAQARGDLESYGRTFSVTLEEASNQVFTIAVYPTQELYDSFFRSTYPRDYAIGVAVIMAGSIALVLVLQARGSDGLCTLLR